MKFHINKMPIEVPDADVSRFMYLLANQAPVESSVRNHVVPCCNKPTKSKSYSRSKVVKRNKVFKQSKSSKLRWSCNEVIRLRELFGVLGKDWISIAALLNKNFGNNRNNKAVTRKSLEIGLTVADPVQRKRMNRVRNARYFIVKRDQ